jgi:hypothetical protein
MRAEDAVERTTSVGEFAAAVAEIGVELMPAQAIP